MTQGKRIWYIILKETKLIIQWLSILKVKTQFVSARTRIWTPTVCLRFYNGSSYYGLRDLVPDYVAHLCIPRFLLHIVCFGHAELPLVSWLWDDLSVFWAHASGHSAFPCPLSGRVFSFWESIKLALPPQWLPYPLKASLSSPCVIGSSAWYYLRT